MKTKEQLIEEVANLEHENEKYLTNDQLRRKEFAKAFNWRKSQGMYDRGENEPSLPTWEQVFVELGKLLAMRDFRDFEGNVSGLEVNLDNHMRDHEKHFEK